MDILIGEYKGHLRLAITDNGSGTNDIKPGSGLSIMRERVQSVGGTLEMESAPGEGFMSASISPCKERRMGNESNHRSAGGRSDNYPAVRPEI